MSMLATALGVSAMLGAALMAGTFFAFSNFVMSALGKLPSAQGIAAMQSINRVVLNRLFLSVFAGTAVIALLAAMTAFTDNHSHSVWMVVAAFAYVAGTFMVTVVRNVPLNDQLASASATAPESLTLWHQYLNRWTRWNHIRTVAACLATVGFAYGTFG